MNIQSFEQTYFVKTKMDRLCETDPGRAASPIQRVLGTDRPLIDRL